MGHAIFETFLKKNKKQSNQKTKNQNAVKRGLRYKFDKYIDPFSIWSKIYNWVVHTKLSQLIFTCSKWTAETLKKVVKYVQSWQ